MFLGKQDSNLVDNYMEMDEYYCRFHVYASQLKKDVSETRHSYGFAVVKEWTLSGPKSWSSVTFCQCKKLQHEDWEERR